MGKGKAVNTEKENLNTEGSVDKTGKESLNVNSNSIDVTLASSDGKRKKAHKTYEFEPPKREATEEERRYMLAKVFEIMITASMKNHVYKFGNKIRVQKKGGPIGLGLTGELADCVMIEWDRKFLKEMSKLGIDPAIYKRFKDDITLYLESLEKGTKLKDGKLVIDQTKKIIDEPRSDDTVTMEVIVEIANKIDPMFQFTYDVPSNHIHRKIAILDVEANINIEENNRLDFQFYEKPTKHKKVMLFDTALPAKQKRTVLTQECLRRLRNTKMELGTAVQNHHLNEFMVKLKNSGYSQNYRIQILDSAQKAYEKMVNDDKNEIKPMYRSRNWNKGERLEDKSMKKVNWYRNASQETEYKTVLFVPVTKGSILAKELRNREEEINRFSKERIKIEESGGVNIKDFLIQKDPFPKNKCEKEKCLICKSTLTTNLSIVCNTNNVGYRLYCGTCRNRGQDKYYEGETARSGRLRGSEHLRDFLTKNSHSALYKHKLSDHPNEEITVGMELTGKFKDALTRQADEAVRIYSRNKSELLNSKSEFNHPPIARVTVEKKKKYGS